MMVVVNDYNDCYEFLDEIGDVVVIAYSYEEIEKYC